MRTTLIDAAGLVVNVIVAGEGYTPPDGLSIGPPDGEIGWTWTGSEWSKPPEPAPPPLTAQQYAAAIQAYVDGVAKTKGYADGVALASYINSTISSWQAEAAAFVPWRDAVWAQAYTILEHVQSGQRPPPTIDDLIAELPQI